MRSRQCKRKVVCLCGSTRFKSKFDEVLLKESLKGNVVFSLSVFEKSDGVSLTPEQIGILSDVHFSKIDMSDEILVINVDGYIGEQTEREIDYASTLGKTVRFLEDPHDTLRGRVIVAKLGFVRVGQIKSISGRTTVTGFGYRPYAL